MSRLLRGEELEKFPHQIHIQTAPPLTSSKGASGRSVMRRSKPAPDQIDLEDIFPTESRIPRIDQVYVNRNLRLPSIGAIGFDLDHTLAHYDPIQVEELAFRTTKLKLVEQRGYPAAIGKIRYDPEFVIRGLVIDKELGNILKMNYHGFVTRAFHGRRELGKSNLKIYRKDSVSLSSKRYISVDTLFHLPEVYLYLSIIDFLEERGEKPDFGRIYLDVREMIDQAHADGSLKNEIRKNPSRFIRTDPKLPMLLDQFRAWGKKVFVLTNSEYYYTDVLLSHLFRSKKATRGRHWSDFFNVVVCDAGKPDFFTARDGRGKAKEIQDIPHNHAYSGGTVGFLEKKLGLAGDQIIYFGDHTYGDILMAKKESGWRTAMVVEELDQELRVTQTLEPKLRIIAGYSEERERLDIERAAIEREKALLEGQIRKDTPQRTRNRKVAQLAYLDKELTSRSEAVDNLDKKIGKLWWKCQRTHNRVWGPLFREGNDTRRFGHQVKDFACLYTSRVTNLLHYASDHYFRSPLDLMAHEL